MNVNFYTFSKRRNSTKQPIGSGTIISCELKEGTSVTHPKLTISGDVFGYDYVYIGDFGRYYFVEDIISEAKGLTTYILEEDSMASNKTAIGNTIAKIEYSSTGYDDDIIDPRIDCYVTKRLSGSVEASPQFSSTGCYVLTVFNNVSGSSCGVATSYMMTQSELQKVKHWMGNDSVFQLIETYFKSNPIDSIFGCIWVPFPYDSTLGTSVTSIAIGNQDSSDVGYTINAVKLSGTGIRSNTANLAAHLRYNSGFRMVEPYTSACVYLPGIGNVDLNMSDWRHSTNINISYNFEYATGNVSYLFFDGNGALIQTANCNVASNCPLGQISFGGNASNAIGVVGGIGTAAVSAASYNVAGVISGGGSALAAGTSMVLSANTRASSISGGVGGRMASIWNAITYTEFSIDTEDPTNVNYIATKGRPVALTHAISSHSGFVKCDGASVSISGESWEREQINGYLNGGFFYE